MSGSKKYNQLDMFRDRVPSLYFSRNTTPIGLLLASDLIQTELHESGVMRIFETERKFEKIKVEIKKVAERYLEEHPE